MSGTDGIGRSLDFYEQFWDDFEEEVVYDIGADKDVIVGGGGAVRDVELEEYSDPAEVVEDLGSEYGSEYLEEGVGEDFDVGTGQRETGAGEVSGEGELGGVVRGASEGRGVGVEFLEEFLEGVGEVASVGSTDEGSTLSGGYADHIEGDDVVEVSIDLDDYMDDYMGEEGGEGSFIGVSDDEGGYEGVGEVETFPSVEGGLPSLDEEGESAGVGSGACLVGVGEVESEGDFGSGSTEVRVGEGGRVGLAGVSKDVPIRDGGRVSDAEARFFANLGVNEWERREALEELRAPGGGVESAEQVDKRLRKVLRGLGGGDALRRGSRLAVRERDFELMDFLARFKYATASQLRYLWGVKELTVTQRLGRLRDLGLVESYTVFGPRPIWFLTRLGRELAGYDLPGVPGTGLAYGMLSHSFVTNHVAANIVGGGLNVLNLPEWPSYRLGGNGKQVRGDEVVSELQLQSSFGKVRVGKSDVYKPQLIAIREKFFNEWVEGGRVGPSPEFLPGNEWMWVLLPGASARLAYHVPDLVVSRERGEDGSPRSIAVEVELNRKARGYRSTLAAYAGEKVLYDKVIWVSRSGGPARELARVAEEFGLLSSGVMDIVPIIGENGVFKGRELWTL